LLSQGVCFFDNPTSFLQTRFISEFEARFQLQVCSSSSSKRIRVYKQQQLEEEEACWITCISYKKLGRLRLETKVFNNSRNLFQLMESLIVANREEVQVNLMNEFEETIFMIEAKQLEPMLFPIRSR
jgi:hypothetical protein